MKVFISHKSSDHALAKKIPADLRANGIHAWLDEWDMPPGEPLSDAMADGVASSDAMLVLLSKDSVSSVISGTGGFAFEVHIAEGRKFKDPNYKIIGILLEDCEPPEKLCNRIGRWLDFKRGKDYRKRLYELISWLKQTPLGPPVSGSHHDVKNIRTALEHTKPIVFFALLLVVVLVNIFDNYLYEFGISSSLPLLIIISSTISIPLLVKNISRFLYGFSVSVFSAYIPFFSFYESLIPTIWYLFEKLVYAFLLSYDGSCRYRPFGALFGCLLSIVVSSAFLNGSLIRILGIDFQVYYNLERLLQITLLWSLIFAGDMIFVNLWNRAWLYGKTNPLQ